MTALYMSVIPLLLTAVCLGNAQSIYQLLYYYYYYYYYYYFYHYHQFKNRHLYNTFEVLHTCFLKKIRKRKVGIMKWVGESVRDNERINLNLSLKVSWI